MHTQGTDDRQGSANPDQAVATPASQRPQRQRHAPHIYGDSPSPEKPKKKPTTGSATHSQEVASDAEFDATSSAKRKRADRTKKDAK